jgi:hypothetical protein
LKKMTNPSTVLTAHCEQDGSFSGGRAFRGRLR